MDLKTVGLAAALGVAGVALYYAHWTNEQCALVQLRADSAEAARDTTRLAEIRALRDAKLWQRRAVQTTLQADQLDRILKSTSAARAALEIRLADLTAQVTSQGSVIETDSIRYGHFEFAQPPVVARADVQLPSPPEKGAMTLQLAFDPMRGSARVTCGQVSHGVAPATVDLVMRPPWAANTTVTIDSVVAEPRVCSPIAANVQIQGALKTPWWTNLVAVIAGWAAGHFKL